MKRMQNYPLLGIALVIGLIFIVMPLTLDLFRLNLIGKYLTYAFVAVGLVLCWGYSGIPEPGAGHLFGLWRLLYGHVSSWKLPRQRKQKCKPPRASRILWTGIS